MVLQRQLIPIDLERVVVARIQRFGIYANMFALHVREALIAPARSQPRGEKPLNGLQSALCWKKHHIEQAIGHGGSISGIHAECVLPAIGDNHHAPLGIYNTSAIDLD